MQNSPLDEQGAWDWVLRCAAGEPTAGLQPDARPQWPAETALTPQARQLLELYLPLCKPPGTPWLIGQLGQSLDGRIATDGGESRYINDACGIRHLHRLRALVDAVIVGGGTAAADDPQLTVRAVSGSNPVRVVLDPQRRLPASLGLFADQAAPTIRVVQQASARSAESSADAAVEELELPPSPDGDSLITELVAQLRARGLTRILVEGGGLTVSRFLAAGHLNRLHLIVAPVILGSGLPAFTLPPLRQLDDALRPDFRRFDLGQDTLFDLALD